MSKIDAMYDRAICAIAADSSAKDMDARDIEVVQTYCSVDLVANIFQKDIATVAGHVIAQRIVNGLKEDMAWALQALAG